MGTGYEATCSKCTYHAEFFLGSGMLFPNTYKSVQKDIRNGKYGEEWKAFLADNPGAVFNAERELYRCRKCNQLLVDYNLSLYVSEDGQPPEHGYWAVWGYHGKDYKFVKRYTHRCPRCSSRMVKQDPLGSAIPCPECGANLIVEGSILWD